MRRNPFKFGSVVTDPYFTNRTAEIQKAISVLNSDNHLILISPRRYGKSSLIFRVIEELTRPVIFIDLQLVTSTHDLAAQLLKRIYRVFPFERVKQFIKHFSIIPSVSINPITNSIDVSFTPGMQNYTMIEDVLNLLDKLGKKDNRLLVVFDEFQEIKKIDPVLLNKFRSIMQHHKYVNYVFLGSQESLIKEIFEKKKSPFYHFGWIMDLDKIPEKDFLDFLTSRFKPVFKEANRISKEILAVTRSHPYYTQQLAYVVWERISNNEPIENVIKDSTEELIRMHDIDYERLWAGFNKTDKKVLIGMASAELSPLSDKFLNKYDVGASSTAYSSLKRLLENGYITKIHDKYEIDDPFFRRWIVQRREA